MRPCTRRTRTTTGTTTLGTPRSRRRISRRGGRTTRTTTTLAIGEVCVCVDRVRGEEESTRLRTSNGQGERVYMHTRRREREGGQ